MLKIRRLRKGDFDDFCRNERSYYMELANDPRFGMGSYGSTLTKKKLKGEFKGFMKNMRSGRQILLVAEEDGHMVGMCVATGNAYVEGPHMVDIGYSVIKECRGRGIATAMMTEMLKRCRKKYEIAAAGFFSNNTASKRLLKKFGFKRWGYGPRFAKRGRIYLDSEFMYLRLSGMTEDGAEAIGHQIKHKMRKRLWK